MLKIKQISNFEEFEGEFYLTLLSCIAGYDERKGINFITYYTSALEKNEKRKKLYTFTYLQDSRKEDGDKESYFETVSNEKNKDAYMSSAREEEMARALSEEEIDSILDELWVKIKKGIRIILGFGEEKVSRFNSELLGACYKKLTNEFRAENRMLSWKALTGKFPALKDPYRTRADFVRPLYVLFILGEIYKDGTAKNQSAIAKRLGLSKQMVNIYMKNHIRPLLISKIMGVGIGSAKKQLTEKYKERKNRIQRIKDLLEGKSEDINLSLIRNVYRTGAIWLCGLQIHLPASIAKTNKKIEAGIRRYAGQEYGEPVFMITVHTAGSKKETLGHCLCRNVSGKLRSLSGGYFVSLTVGTKETEKIYSNLFKKLRKGIIEAPPIEALEAQTNKWGLFHLKGRNNQVQLNLPCHKYSLTIIGANETAVIAEFVSLERLAHKEWKMLTGRGIDKNVAYRWGIAAIEEEKNGLTFYPHNKKQQAIYFTLTLAYRKSRELRKETSSPLGEI